MASFRFKATTAAGAVETGEIDARTKAEAYKAIMGRKLRPVSIAPLDEAGGAVAGTAGEPVKAEGMVRRLPANQVLLFTEELSELLEAGLQLEPALKVIETRKERSPLKVIGATLRQQVRDGVSFSNALRSCGDCFSDLFCSMVAAGETAGALPKILRRQAEYFAIMTDLRKRITMALVYPSIVFSAGVLLLIIFMTFLLPQLTVLLSKTGKELPLMTRMLVGTSEFFGSYWWAVILLLVGLGMAFTAWRRTPEGRMTWDRVKLDLPLVGPVLRVQFLAEFSQTLSTLVSNGVILLNALTLLQRATANVYLKGILGKMVDRVGEGSSLSAALRHAPFFPAVLIDIMNVGEQTGDLAGALQRSATRYDKEFTNRIQHMTTLIQPLTILVVALFVGLVAYSMITGILTSVSGLRTR
ncbi:MAG: type II secretion system F family protein [Chthoniobacterales bacterium]